MNILAIDTSNQILGAALMRGDELVGGHVTNVSKNHSVRLMPAVEQLMQEVGMQPEQLDKIVVANGPGSYTGVRIGVTTAKTMAWALNIPVAGVSSLEVLAYQGRFADSLICPFFDARRGLVFAGLYLWKDGQMANVRADENLLLADLLEELKEKKQNIVFLSPDLALHQEAIRDALGTHAVIPVGPYHYPSPVHLAYAGKHKQETDLHALAPNYLRLAEAEAKWIQMQKENQHHE